MIGSGTGQGGSGTAVPYFAHRGRLPGVLGWLVSTDHKRIGILYLTAVLSFFAAAVVLGVLMRIELMSPGPTIMSAQTYNALFTLHGIIQIFLVVIPAIPAIFGNFFLPILIGARDMAFPRLNLFSFYLYLCGAALAFVSVFSGGGAVDTGWTFYVPFSLETQVNVPLATFAVFVLGMSSILTGINIVTTTHQLRAPGMTFFRMPLSVWGLYATAWVQILATPVIGITMVLIIVERVFGIGVFDPTKGGDPLLYQHLFWIYSHPAVYIMILPAMGIISDLFPVFSRREHRGLQDDRVFEPRHRQRRVAGVGPPHVRERAERHREHRLLAAHLPRGGAERDQGVQLGRDPLPAARSRSSRRSSTR